MGYKLADGSDSEQYKIGDEFEVVGRNADFLKHLERSTKKRLVGKEILLNSYARTKSKFPRWVCVTRVFVIDSIGFHNGLLSIAGVRDASTSRN